MLKLQKAEITKAINQRLSEQPELEDGEPYAYEIGFDDGVKWVVEQMDEKCVEVIKQWGLDAALDEELASGPAAKDYFNGKYVAYKAVLTLLDGEI